MILPIYSLLNGEAMKKILRILSLCVLLLCLVCSREHNPFSDKLNSCVIKETAKSTDGHVYVKYAYARTKIDEKDNVSISFESSTQSSEKAINFFREDMYRHIGNVND